ncbi:carbohydrate sulfotransferase 1-like [Glandiceps talaboti]
MRQRKFVILTTSLIVLNIVISCTWLHALHNNSLGKTDIGPVQGNVMIGMDQTNSIVQHFDDSTVRTHASAPPFSPKNNNKAHNSKADSSGFKVLKGKFEHVGTKTEKITDAIDTLRNDYLKYKFELKTKSQHDIDNGVKKVYNTSHPLNVVVLASIRTGSSFVGEILKQNPMFIYFYEPIKSLGLEDDDPRLLVQGVDMLENLYRCRFDQTSTEMFLDKMYNPKTGVGKLGIVFAWVDESIPDVIEDCGGRHGTHCFRMTPKKASETCKVYRYRGVKTIRLHELSTFLPLIKNEDIGLKIINLIRDPRAMLASVIPLHLSNFKLQGLVKVKYPLTLEHLNKGIIQRLNKYCTSLLRNILLGIRGNWFPRDQYYPLRYEDMAIAPLEMTKEVYDFLGIDMIRDVNTWLEMNTKRGYTGSFRVHPYSTRRNSHAASQAWRGRITFDLAKEIENTGDCGDLMDVVGYKRVTSPAMLKNMSISLIF